MTTPNLSIPQLENLLKLTKERLALALDLEKVDQKIAGFFTGESTDAKPAEAPTRRRGRGKRIAGRAPQSAYGSQKEKILAVLKEAGVEGLSVAEVAEKIGAKPKNLAPWFYTAGKKVGVKKVARGRFTLVEKASTAVSKPAKASRGTLKPRILAVLAEARADGLSVAEVAEKIGAKKNAVNVWFYTTGKKVKGLKKVARGRFALKG